MLIRVLLAAIFAGVLAGAFATGVQSWRVTPLILEAERYENVDGVEGHSHSSDATQASDATQTDVAEAEEVEAWGPEDGFERVFYTGLSNMVAGVAFSLLLTAGILFTNSAISLQSGLVWGLCGFVAFVLAPNFGLSPELPGMQAAGVVERQVWWVATVSMSAVGLMLFAFKREIVWMLLGVCLLIAPHLYGAPQPITHESAVPANLAADFVIATIVSSALFWAFLGAVLGYLLNRANEKEEAV